MLSANELAEIFACVSLRVLSKMLIFLTVGEKSMNILNG